MSMQPIRAKDKLFLAIVLPVAIASAYLYFWRAKTVHRISSLERECAALVSTDDFPAEKRQAERRLAAAREDVVRERQTPLPTAKVVANAADGIAVRELAVLEVFRQSCLDVTSGSTVDASADTHAGDVLKATGCCPAPVCRTYALEGNYPDVVAALRQFVARRQAVIPESVAMPTQGRWALTLWL